VNGVPRDPKVLSPNQLQKQDQIVAAAQAVLLRDGLAGCTVRSIAAEGPLTKSAIHYYFDDLDVLIDRAMAAHINEFLTALRTVADKHEDPRVRLFEVLRSFLDAFSQRATSAFRWFEYWIAASRADHPKAIEVMLRSMTELLTELLAAIGGDDPRARARALLSYLLGTIVQQQVRKRPFTTLRAEIEQLCLSESLPAVH
jgi:AcrR family transcriptional regulator